MEHRHGENEDKLPMMTSTMCRISQLLQGFRTFADMYNAQSFPAGLNLPPTSLGCPGTNGEVQLGFFQGSTDSRKAHQMLQQLRKQALMNLDCRVSDGNNSHSGAMMAPIGLPENFQASAGLMRYNSAPGSFLVSLEDDGSSILPHVSGAGPDNALSRILSNDSSLTTESNSGAIKHNDSSQSSKTEPENHLEEHNNYSRMVVHNSSHRKRSSGNVAEEDLGKHNHVASVLENGMEASQNSFCSSQMSKMCQAQGPQSGEQLMNNTFKQNPVLYNAIDSSGERPGSLPLSATKSSLVRHSSSPAGALSRMTSDGQRIPENGYLEGVTTNGKMGVSTLASENGSCGTAIAPNRVSQQMNFSRQSSSPAGLLTQLSMDMEIPEIVDKLNMNMGRSSGESLARCSSDSARLGSVGQGQGYISSLSTRSWEDGTMLSGNYEGIQNSANFSARKRGRDIDEKMILGLNLPEKLEGEARRHSASALANHHFGLYESGSSEIALEKILEESVPCRIRAKRGCATHPRSIAERVRRTRISDRIRKLQELVPNMEKQTNTADMLDEAVEYVKLLQKKVQELSEKQCKCDCASREQADVNKA
jgi:hypothetical protein